MAATALYPQPIRSRRHARLHAPLTFFVVITFICVRPIGAQDSDNSEHGMVLALVRG